MFGFFKGKKQEEKKSAGAMRAAAAKMPTSATIRGGSWQSGTATVRVQGKVGPRPLAESLVDSGAISRTQLEQALMLQKRTGGFLGQLLVDLGYLRVEALIDFLKRNSRDPHTRLVDRDTGEDVADVLPLDLCRTLNLIPVDKAGRRLVVAMLDPSDAQAVEHVRRACPSLIVKPVRCGRPLFEALLEWYGAAGAPGTPMSELPEPQSLGDLLVSRGVIRREQLEAALVIQGQEGGFLGQGLVDLHALSQFQLISAIAKHSGISHVRLRDFQQTPETLGLLSPDLCRECRVLPVVKKGRNVTLAVVDPMDAPALDRARQALQGYDIELVLCGWADFRNTAENFLPSAPSTDALPEETLPVPPDSIGNEALPTPLPESDSRANPTPAQETPAQSTAVPNVDLARCAINETAVKKLPKGVCLSRRVLPVALENGVLTIAMVDPGDAEALDEIRKTCSDLEIKPVLCTWTDFRQVSRRVFSIHEHRAAEDFFANSLQQVFGDLGDGDASDR